ncbi:MAG: hypothetical protein ACLP05_10790 [Candidatus Kryptoniota bacterium]
MTESLGPFQDDGGTNSLTRHAVDSEYGGDRNVFRFERENSSSNSLLKGEIKDYYHRFYGRTDLKCYGDKIARRFLR